jgi:hypothetical protein
VAAPSTVRRRAAYRSRATPSAGHVARAFFPRQVVTTTIARGGQPMLWTRRKAGGQLAGERFMTLIDASATVDGRLEYRESLRIDGRVTG